MRSIGPTRSNTLRTKKTTFILISGKAGVGKTTLANYLATKLSSIKGLDIMQVALADPIKVIARKEFGWNGIKDFKGRKLLQTIGTDCGRNYDENIWVKKMLDFVFTANIYPPHFVIIDDWRFPNEYFYIDDLTIHNVVTIRVEAPNREILKGTPEETHPSETSLPVVTYWTETNIYDYVVDNSESFNELYRQGDQIVHRLENELIIE